MKKILNFIYLFAFINCNAQFIEFVSPDSVTGGFEVIYFQLKADGKFNIIDSTAVWIGETKSGGIYKWNGDTIGDGKWQLKNDFIHCSFDKGKKVLDSLFTLGETKTRSLILRNNAILFRQETDIVFIRGIPCVKIIRKR